MKFTDGFWLNKEGFDIHYPRTIRDIRQTSDDVTLYGPCKDIQNRGDTLNIPLLTVTLSSPMENVIRVRAYHHKGGLANKPKFEVLDEQHGFKVTEWEDRLWFSSGQLHLDVTKAPFALSFYHNNQKLTHSDAKGISWITGPENESYMRGQLNLGVGEMLYGMGERFTPFVKNGQIVDIWNKDGGTSSEQAYKNIPFYVSNKGYGVFVNHPEHVSFEAGSEAVSKSQISVEGEVLDYYIIDGPEPKDVVKRYTDLTGKPALPPAWSFGLWLSTSFTTDYNEETVNHFVDGMADRDIPLSVFHFDCFWMKEFEWSSFQWDRDNFPDPEGMLKRLKAKGLKISLWINPYIAQKSPLFDEAMKNGYLLTKENGDVWQWDMWQAGMGIVDFTNPDACKWYIGKLKALLDMGVDTFKTDFGERIPTDVKYHDGSDPDKMHNYYSYLFNKTVFELLEKEKGEHEAVVFARSASVGGQKFPVHWGGDCDATYESMAESLRGGLSLTMSGFGYWSHDIGGFENNATADLFKRWAAFGLLSTHSRLHGSSSYRVPWLYDEEAVDVTRHFVKLKNRLMPYLFSQAVENHNTGVPAMRAMVLEYPDDPTCHMLDRQYMLGDSLLVAPILNEDGVGQYYLPKGNWTHLLTGETVEGGCWFEKTFDYMSLPLYVKPNTILPIGKHESKPDYDYASGVTFQVFGLAEGHTASRTIYETSGRKAGYITITRDHDTLAVQTDLTDKSFSIQLIGFTSVKSVSYGTWEVDESGVLITPEKSKNNISIKI